LTTDFRFQPAAVLFRKFFTGAKPLFLNLKPPLQCMNELNKTSILVAEDNEDGRLMVRVFLENLGYRVIEARNGREAVEMAKAFRPDLILMDLNMPELDGLSAVRCIRRFAELAEIPILANSADGMRGIDLFSDIKSFGPGYLEYIAKPLNLTTLADQIEIALASVRQAA
jgi:CheY-like chemotaxis protein